MKNKPMIELSCLFASIQLNAIHALTMNRSAKKLSEKISKVYILTLKWVLNLYIELEHWTSSVYQRSSMRRRIASIRIALTYSQNLVLSVLLHNSENIAFRLTGSFNLVLRSYPHKKAKRTFVCRRQRDNTHTVTFKPNQKEKKNTSQSCEYFSAKIENVTDRWSNNGSNIEFTFRIHCCIWVNPLVSRVEPPQYI